MKDLHIHTKYSDGEYAEDKIISEIVKAGITEFAICDHDTIEGSKKINDLIKSNNLNLIFHSGVELSCRIKEIGSGINIHLLVRDFDYKDKNIIKMINKISLLRLKKIQLMVDLIKDIYGVEIKNEEIAPVLKTTNSFGKPHMYRILCQHGNYDRKEYYKNMDKLKSENLKLDAKKVLNTLKDSGYDLTLAHPREVMKEYDLNYSQLENIIKFLKDNGLNGLETLHTNNIGDDYDKFSQIAKKYDLKESCGSDYHGPTVKPDVLLGTFHKIDNISNNFIY